MQPVTEGRCPTEYNGTGIRFQDPKTNKWFYATFEVIPSSFEEFKKSVRHPSGVKYVVHWNSPYGPHCVYSREWLPKEGKVKLSIFKFATGYSQNNCVNRQPLILQRPFSLMYNKYMY